MPITLNGTTGEVFPSWTTATRPASPTAGQTGYNTTTKQLEVYNGSAWVIDTMATSQGTSGQVLTSAGAGAAPTWGSASGALIRAPQILTSGTSYTTPSNCTEIYVEAVGGGGGGGGGISTNPASGGGAGAYCAKYFTVTASTAYTYAIGAAGTAGAGGGSGGTGGNTTFTVGATTITAGGGNNGVSGATGGSGGTATNGDLNVGGGSGMSVLGSGMGGLGGNSFFGGGGKNGGSTNQVGQAASAYGGGGGGGAIASAGTTTGGAGGAGVIRIWEFT